MAALVQSFPQQSSTMTMLDTRPTSASGHFQQDRPSQQQRSHNARSLYGGGGSNANVHRGQTSNAPVAPYAFTSTPSLAGYANPLRQNPSLPYLRQENRAVTAPPAPTGFSNAVSSKPRSATPANDITPSPRPDGPLQAVKSLPGGSLDLSLSDPRLAASSSATAAKPSPDRYRRLNHRSSSGGLSSPLGGASSSPSGSGMAAVNHLYQHPGQSLSSPALRSNTSGSRLQSVDDSVLSRNGEQKKHRRRSMSGLGPADAPTGQPAVVPPPMTRSYASVVSTPYTPGKREARPIQRAPQPASSHGRNGSQESVSSRSASRPGSVSSHASTPSRSAAWNADILGQAKRDDSPLRAHISAQSGTGQRLEPKLVNVPQRGSSDNNRRTVNPSPLSKPVAMKSDLPVAINGPGKGNVVANAQDSPAPAASEARAPESAAARHLAALNKKDGKGEKKPSRLRRAFSFSSASELKKAAEASSSSVQAAAAATASPAGPATTSQSRPSNKLRKEQPADDELMAREAAIVQRQEAGGLGSSIYSGQGHFFTGSTDNLSVSSTASSASLMLRKMGHGVKRSTRSLVGLFRPKSMVGAPGALAEPSAPAASAAQVSMVTVEAEREKVNVNLDPHDQVGGGTGFPRLERNSLDAASMGAGSEPALSFSSTSDGRTPAQTGMQAPRRSIVGGERERAEALAAVKKGILKRMFC